MNTSSLSSTFETYRDSPRKPFNPEKNFSQTKVLESPRIGDKLDELQKTLDVEGKICTTTELEKRIKNLDDRVNFNNRLSGDKFKAISEQIPRLENHVAVGSALIQELNEVKSQDIHEVEDDITLRLEIENQNCKESQQRIFKKIEDKLYNFKVEVVKEQKKIDAITEKHSLDISKQINALQVSLDTEIKKREEDNKRIIQKAEGHISQLQDMLVKENKARKEKENSLFKSLDEMNKQFQNLVDAEHRKRESSEEQMIELIELACKKIEDLRMNSQEKNIRAYESFHW